MTRIKGGTNKFQAGGILDEDDLFKDDEPLNEMPAGGSQGKLASELVDNVPADLGKIGQDGGGMNLPADDDGDGDGDGDDDGDEVELTGVEQFLTNYGVQGGIIQYEDGTSARFSDLNGIEQAEILSSLTQEAVPTIEEKYNLEDAEVNLLNSIRESGQTPEEFMNNMIDYRTQTLLAQQELSSIDYEAVSDDAIYVKSLRDENPDITTDEIASELAKAKELRSYSSSVNALRSGYMAEQENSNRRISAEHQEAFAAELEQQRFAVVGAVEDINDIAGAAITDSMKEYLLQDLMELNENNDPILMEKIFSDPQTMFEVNWFLTYGKDYMQSVDAHWKKAVSQAQKTGYAMATGGMPRNPTVVSPTGGAGRQKGNAAPVSDRFGRILTEEELFEQENNNQ